jgi:hypothetical protein
LKYLIHICIITPTTSLKQVPEHSGCVEVS